MNDPETRLSCVVDEEDIVLLILGMAVKGRDEEMKKRSVDRSLNRDRC